jgi:ABC-type polar amino acid transport system ATPase subunit
MLKITGLSKAIRGVSILKNLSMHVHAGQVAVLLGRSGAGKSTLLRILSGIDRCDSGEIVFGSSERSVGMVLQHFNLFEHLTVIENITLALVKVKKMAKHQARHKAEQLLQRYGLAGKGDSKVHQLSGGQKQRLAIARTVALDPDVICLDEPTSALDPLLTRQVAEFIAELAAEGKAVVVTSHDLGLIGQLDATFYLMEGGEIKESATTANLKGDKGAYPKLSGYMEGAA